MKINLSFATKGLLILLFVSFQTNAQNSMNSSKVIAESPYLTASEVTLKPGEKTNVHTHPAHFYYALTSGKLLVLYQDGGKEVFDLKSGESGVSDPEKPHTTENIGKNTVKFLIVELKEHPYTEK